MRSRVAVNVSSAAHLTYFELVGMVVIVGKSKSETQDCDEISVREPNNRADRSSKSSNSSCFSLPLGSVPL